MPKKGGLGQFADVRGGGLTKKIGWCFGGMGGGGLRYPNAHYEALNTIRPLYIDGVQPAQDYGGHYKKSLYFLSPSPQEFLVLS